MNRGLFRCSQEISWCARASQETWKTSELSQTTEPDVHWQWLPGAAFFRGFGFLSEAWPRATKGLRCLAPGEDTHGFMGLGGSDITTGLTFSISVTLSRKVLTRPEM